MSLAIATAACLDIPDPVADAGPNGDGGDGGSGALCGETSDFTSPQKLQTIGATAGALNIRDAVVADVNADGIDDLVLLNADVAADADQKVFIALGPLDPSDLDIHVVIDTLSAPAAVALAELSGDGCLDMAIFGANKQTDAGFVELYVNAAGASPGQLFEAAPVTHQAGFRPAYEDAPTFIVPGRFGADDSIDFVLADLSQVSRVAIEGVPSEGLGSAVNQPLLIGMFSLTNGVFAFANGADDTIDDLVIVEHAAIHWVERGGSNMLDAVTTQTTASGLQVLGAFELQIDVPAPAGDLVDIFGAGASSAAAWRIVDDTPGAVVMTEVPFADPNLLQNAQVGNNDGTLDKTVATSLDGDEFPDVVIFDHDPANGSFAVLILDVRREGASFPQTVVNDSLAFTGFNPRAAAAIDVDNDGDDEIYAIDPNTGESRCLEVNQSFALVTCP